LPPTFGLFKRKDNASQFKNTKDSNELQSTSTSLSISDALKLLNHIESEKIATLSSKISPIKESVVKSLKSIEKVADDLERDKIKLEEPKFKTIVENSKRTILTSIRRETSLDIQLLESLADVQKFKEKLESIINYFGGVSASHSRVFNVFMKKYASRLKNEFETLSSLFKETESLTKEFEQDRQPLARCNDILNTLSQKICSIKVFDENIKNASKKMEVLEKEIQELKHQLNSLEFSNEYEMALHTSKQIYALEKEEEELRRYIHDLFAHTARAFTKYSYDATKENLQRLKILEDEPWKIFDEANISPYTLLIVEVRRAINSDKIKLKDSEKVIRYFDVILESLPKFQGKIQDIKVTLKTLSENNNRDLIKISKELREKIDTYNKDLENHKQTVQKLKAGIVEENNDIKNLLKDAEELLFNITGKKYFVLV
jgi:conjugal transfer/entry exclusion protein